MPDQTAVEAFMTTREAAEYAGYSPQVLKAAAASGALKAHRRPTEAGRGRLRFKAADIDAWLAPAEQTA